MSKLESIIQNNLTCVSQEIADATSRSGRKAHSAQLIAITKYVGPEEVRALFSCGCRALGESRPQALWDKASQTEDLNIDWHSIGHLQRNKIKRTLPLIQWLHSGDSLRLLNAIDRELENTQETQPDSNPQPPLKLFLEVNISGDESKGGFTPGQLRQAIPSISKMKFVSPQGLMGMASRDGGREGARRDFEGLRNLRDELVAEFSGAVDFPHLSMGMSRDFDIAIEEGATMVRVGSRLFEGIDR